LIKSIDSDIFREQSTGGGDERSHETE
jgi:hypothetical protein